VRCMRRRGASRCQRVAARKEARKSRDMRDGAKRGYVTRYAAQRVMLRDMRYEALEAALRDVASRALMPDDAR